MGARWWRAARPARRVGTTGAGRFAAVILAMSTVLFAGFGSSPASTVARRLATTPQAQTRYGLVHGCYSLSSPSRGTPIAASVGPFTMQAAALGVYLLYGPQAAYLTDDGTGDLSGTSAPSAATEWTVDGSSAQGFTMTNTGTGTRLPVTFVPARGCAPYPEAQVDAVGTPFSGASAEADVLGTVEGHAHVTAFEFLGGDWHCGRPWSPFGVAYALPASCAAEEQGTNGAFESLIDYGVQRRREGGADRHHRPGRPGQWHRHRRRDRSPQARRDPAGLGRVAGTQARRRGALRLRRPRRQGPLRRGRQRCRGAQRLAAAL
jgi:hypothetical protein